MSANALLHKPYDHVKQSLVRYPRGPSHASQLTMTGRQAKDGGTARDCVVKSFIENSVHGAQDREYMEGVAKAVSATIYIGKTLWFFSLSRPSVLMYFVSGGSDTVSIVETEHNSATLIRGSQIATCLSWFVLAMVLNPKIRREAQKSIDEVCQGRLPDFSDYDSLPYVHAVAREVLRWNPVTPLSEPFSITSFRTFSLTLCSQIHRIDSWRTTSTKATSYPKAPSSLPTPGTHLLPPAFAMLTRAYSRAIMHDPEMYPSPDAFSPARFLTTTRDALDPAVRDPSEVVFGFGRRICPGQHMAYEALWITVACILAVFDIETVKGKRGEPVMPEVEVDYGFSA